MDEPRRPRRAICPHGFTPIASSANSPFAAIADEQRRLYGLQFHPEVVHTPQGGAILDNFVKGVCGCTGDWTAGHFIDETVQRIRAQVGEDGHAICGLSGGVDSAVAATLAHEAIGDRLTCVFVDHGLLRKGEAEQVVQTFREHQGMRLIAVDASEDFLTDLAGVSDPEQKRKLIGARFIRVFEAEAARLAAEWGVDSAAFLVQGTLYPDVIESASNDDTRHARTIKTHHNVGGLPADMTFRLIEPLRMLFKDEVRAVGEALGLPEEIVWRHPFPGPGLGIRILGDVTWERLETLREADAIFLDELRAAQLYRDTSQVFAVLLPVRSVGVMGDGRTYANTVALRAVTTRRLHDRGLGAAALRPAGEDQQPHRQRGGRRRTASCTISAASRRRRSSGSEATEQDASSENIPRRCGALMSGRHSSDRF